MLPWELWVAVSVPVGANTTGNTQNITFCWVVKIAWAACCRFITDGVVLDVGSLAGEATAPQNPGVLQQLVIFAASFPHRAQECQGPASPLDTPPGTLQALHSYQHQHQLLLLLVLVSHSSEVKEGTKKTSNMRKS